MLRNINIDFSMFQIIIFFKTLQNKTFSVILFKIAKIMLCCNFPFYVETIKPIFSLV